MYNFVVSFLSFNSMFMEFICIICSNNYLFLMAGECLYRCVNVSPYFTHSAVKGLLLPFFGQCPAVNIRNTLFGACKSIFIRCMRESGISGLLVRFSFTIRN
jgi:hypothetical protein